MNREFVDIVTSVSNYEECQYRLGGGCKATSIGVCSKKCRFFTPSLSLSNYQQKAVIAFKAQKERIEALENEIEKLKQEGVINGRKANES